jgi:hypothetical protein
MWALDFVYVVYVVGITLGFAHNARAMTISTKIAN